MDNPAVKPLEFTLARSATQFETKKKGLLPPSHVMMRSLSLSRGTTIRHSRLTCTVIHTITPFVQSKQRSDR